MMFEWYQATGEYVVHVVDGLPVDVATDEDGARYTFICSPSTGYCWVEVGGRTGLSPTQPRRGLNVEWFRRYVNGIDCR